MFSLYMDVDIFSEPWLFITFIGLLFPLVVSSSVFRTGKLRRSPVKFVVMSRRLKVTNHYTCSLHTPRGIGLLTAMWAKHTIQCNTMLHHPLYKDIVAVFDVWLLTQ